MFRSHLRRSVAALVLLTISIGAAPAAAEEHATPEAAEARSLKEAVSPRWATEPSESHTLRNVLYGSYAVVHGLDMYSTVVARRRGAVEANPVMAGSFARGAAVKALMGITSGFAARAIEKKSRKAAIVSLLLMNAATAAVVANNVRNAQRLNAAAR